MKDREEWAKMGLWEKLSLDLFLPPSKPEGSRLVAFLIAKEYAADEVKKALAEQAEKFAMIIKER